MWFELYEVTVGGEVPRLHLLRISDNKCMKVKMLEMASVGSVILILIGADLCDLET
jgi:hypothetical protein